MLYIYIPSTHEVRDDEARKRDVSNNKVDYDVNQLKIYEITESVGDKESKLLSTPLSTEDDELNSPQTLFINIAEVDFDAAVALSSIDDVMDNVEKFGKVFDMKSNLPVDGNFLKNNLKDLEKFVDRLSTIKSAQRF